MRGPRPFALLAAAVTFALAASPRASGAERLTDEQVEKLIEDIKGGFDTWKKDLEKQNLDDAVLTSAERTVKVKDFLKDFDKAIDVMKDRFKSEYAATPEALTLLRRGSDVELRNRRQALTPGSSWAALGTKLQTLAQAYAVSWPVESMNVLTARLNDGELAAKVEGMESAAKVLQSDAERAAKANKAIDKAARESLKTDIKGMGLKAKDVRARLEDDRPASVEVGQLFAQTTKVRETLARLSLPATSGGWPAIDSANEALARAFSLPKP